MVTVRQSQFGIAITWIVVNTIIMLCGAGVAIIGFLVSFSPEGLCFLYKNDLREVLAEIYAPNLATKCIDFGEILNWEAKLTVMFFGSFLFFFGLFAVAVAVWPRASALAVYIAVITIYVVVLMVVLILYFIAMDVATSYNATDFVRDQLNNTFVERYEGDDSFDDFTRFVNFVHRKFNCCGINGLQSFNYAKNWEKYYTLPTAPGSPEVILTMNQLPMSCCMRERLKDCIADVNLKRLSNAWVMLGCFEGELAADGEAVAKYTAIGMSVFTLFLAFSITLAFIICTPILASRRRKSEDIPTAITVTAEGTPPSSQPQTYPPPPPPLPPGRPIKKEVPIVEDSVTRWHSQFGSRFYDSQIFQAMGPREGAGNRNNGPRR